MEDPIDMVPLLLTQAMMLNRADRWTLTAEAHLMLILTAFHHRCIFIIALAYFNQSFTEAFNILE